VVFQREARIGLLAARGSDCSTLAGVNDLSNEITINALGEQMIRLVEVNLGRWKPTGILIIDNDFRIRARKGKISEESLVYYTRFPVSEMHTGDTLQNENTYMMKVTERIAILVEMENEHLARISAMNLKGRTNAFAPFDGFEKQLEKEVSRNEMFTEDESVKGELVNADPRYRALFEYSEVAKREKDSFVLDKNVLKVICDSRSISLSELRQRLSRFEEMLGERIDLAQIKSICDRYVREGLIKQL
jgi:hypothetical protein